MQCMVSDGQTICRSVIQSVSEESRCQIHRLIGGDNSIQIRSATPNDAEAIATIYNQGIEDRIATFETHFRSAEDVQAWFDDVHPVLIVEKDSEIIAFASSSAYSARECYAGIAECSVYVKRDMRHHGAGRIALEALIRAAEEAGFWKLVSRVFIDNKASRKLIGSLGFREVGIYEKHAKLDGMWRDVIIVERLISGNLK
jgi:L-amino acid N-acyltransferase YncA